MSRRSSGAGATHEPLARIKSERIVEALYLTFDYDTLAFTPSLPISVM